MKDHRYVYSFVPWPDETRDWPRAVHDLWRVLATRVEMSFTEAEFAAFRDALAAGGFTLREAKRRTGVDWEPLPW